ncbi:MAG: hypothetical protein FD169_1110 [Bacillota bacterium]|nr:MAG: hypothetical protein FD169_1110 [Bacillota bacterium]MBS3950017.1 hypothetical protein [Peptococcaceae bacterium]
MKRYLTMGLAVALLTTALSGCAMLNNRKYDRELKTLLPGESGFEWRYFGFAEYDHFMKLNSIETKGATTRYLISGEVGDPSGGESQKDHSLQIIYTINQGALVQEKQEEMMMDSEFNRIEILRGPVVKGSTWTQQQVDNQGQTKTLDCVIEDVRIEQGIRTFVVFYRERNGVYYEKREIREAVGITLCEKLWITPEENFVIGYYLFEGE